MPSKKASSRSKISLKKASPKKASSKVSSKKASPGAFSRFSRWLDSISPTSILAIGLCVLSLSVVHALFIDLGSWYSSLFRSNFDLPVWFFDIALTGVFTLLTISLVLIWNIKTAGRTFIIWLFLLLGMFHVAWSMLFFGFHMVSTAFLDTIAIWTLLWIIIPLVWRRSKTASLLLVPYVAWIALLGVFNGLIAFHYVV